MQSKATTVDQYMAELPEDRRAALSAVRQTIRANIDKDVEECMGYGMPGYAIPHRVYPPGYHCDPSVGLPFAGFASQKNYMSVYLMTVYGEGAEENWFREKWAKTGKKLDMGKCCIRFKKLEDLALDVIGEAIRRVSAKDFIAHYERSILSMNKSATAKRAAKGTAKKATAATPATAPSKTTPSKTRPSKTRPSKKSATKHAAKPAKERATTPKAGKKAAKKVAKKAAKSVAKPAAKKRATRRDGSR